jgi:guanidinopropionase
MADPNRKSRAELGLAPASSRFLALRAVDDEEIESADVVLFGVPSDVGTDGRLGAAEGPEQVRAASWTFGSFNHALGQDILDGMLVADGGDLDVATSDASGVLQKVQSRAFDLCRGGQVPGMIGGTQVLTLGALRGVLQAKRRPVTVVQLTASHSLRVDSEGEGGMMRRAHKEQLLKSKNVLQIGVRGPSHNRDEPQDAFRSGFERLTVDEVRWDIHGSMAAVRKLAGGAPIYLSVDLSCMDPSICPGVTRPSPGGLNSWEMQQVLRSLVGADIVGFDVVGLCPRWDASDLASVVAVNILHEILAAVADTRDGSRVSLLGGSVGRTSA